ncbi:hypothetical protein [uncultured Fusobacterium sp.]|uniref:hypothetical protein n=1 Tax=uncultured Fusobacterium sp. TaxID=159267 RepID=UPI0027DDBF79|nr:hypothetical protein [uncultured Fusobacterium sp.]
MGTYREPVKIVVDKEVPTTVAALNKTLIITHEKNADFKYYTSSAEVAEAFGNNSETYKLVEIFLSQTDGSGNILKPDFFSIVGVEKLQTAEATEENPEPKEETIEEYAARIKVALNEVLGEEWYAFITTLNDPKMLAILRPFIVENRKYYIAESTTYPIEDTAKSDRILLYYNPTAGEYKAAAYTGATITVGAGAKSSLVEVAGVTADVAGGKKQELTQNNITFTEKRTSEGYIVANGGMALDGTYLDETTAIDCIIVNLNENLQKNAIKKGYRQDDRGYALVEDVLTKTLKEMGKIGLIAVLNGNYEYKVFPVTQTQTEREQRIMRPRVLFRLAGWGYFIDLTLQQTNKEIGGAN